MFTQARAFFLGSVVLFSIPSFGFAADPVQQQPPQPQVQPQPQAQSASGGHNYFGLAGGANFSGLTNQNPATGNTEIVGGIFADWAMSQVWYLETGLRYQSYGISASAVSGGSTLTVSSDAHYLEIPILLKPIFDAGGWYPYLMVGPDVGFKISETGTVTINGTSLSASTSIYNTVNFSANAGAGAMFPFSEIVRGLLQFDYSLGVINVISPSANAGRAFTRGATVTAGVVLAF